MRQVDNSKGQGGRAFAVGAAMAALSVGMGAIGAHLLESFITENFPDSFGKRIDSWEVASRYLMYGAVGMMAVGMFSMIRKSKLAKWAGLLIFVGAVLFSGFLYGWVLLDKKWMVHVVPLGGFLQIAGWVILALAGLMAKTNNEAKADMTQAELGGKNA